MFPNPQEALPLPSRPNLEQYKKRAKDLVKACRSGDPGAIRAWAHEWLQTSADQVADFARTRLSPESGSCALADAQFVIARSFGFASWPKFAAHIESLERANSPVAVFESAVDAVVTGEAATLADLLREQPGLVRERSTREHHATLLIYTSANGVEGYRQKSPKNAAAIAEMLLDAGAEVDATAAVYGAEYTTLGLVATSAPPAIAGVQLPLIDLLLSHGARMDRFGGHGYGLVRDCLANGQPTAAEHLVSRGAPLDLVGAAGLGRVDVLQKFFDGVGHATAGATMAQMADALALASSYGRADAVSSLLDHGIDVNAELKGHGAGHTALHVAAYHGHVDVVNLLLARGARVDVTDKTWKTPPLSWVLTGWARKEADADDCYEIVALLVHAGAVVTPELLDWDNVQADPKMRAALKGTLRL
jgi:ankyrin repeat protein